MTISVGIQIEPQFGFDYQAVEEIALTAEKSGYDSLWSSDHFFLDDKSEDKNCMEAWTLIAAFASKTEKLRLGTLVTCNSYKYPAVLAKIAATVDQISNGRLEFGIGASWKEIEYNAYASDFHRKRCHDFYEILSMDPLQLRVRKDLGQRQRRILSNFGVIIIMTIISVISHFFVFFG